MKLQSAKSKIQKAHDKDEWARAKGLRVHQCRAKAFDDCLNKVVGEDYDLLFAWYQAKYFPKD